MVIAMQRLDRTALHTDLLNVCVLSTQDSNAMPFKWIWVGSD
jgi:hypothetical protein